MSPTEPKLKRTVVFIDGQNLHYAVKNAFGYAYPNYDVQLLSEKICLSQNWKIEQIRFYTGIPDINDDSFWHNFWTRKLAVMGHLLGFWLLVNTIIPRDHGPFPF